MLTTKFFKKTKINFLAKNPLFWSAVILFFLATAFFTGVDIDSGEAQTAVVGEGTGRYIAKWIDPSALYRCDGPNCIRDDVSGTFTSADCNNTCSVPKYRCDGPNCVRDDISGTFITSNCDNMCDACINLVFNSNNSSVSPSSVNVRGAYTIACDYGVAGIDSINVTAGSGSCSFSNFNGTRAIFNCTAGSTAGVFRNFCRLIAGTSSNTCAQTNQINNLTVIGDAQDGACGPADGQTFSVRPSIGLCSAGTASAVFGTGPWTWTCFGSNGGINAVCGAGVVSAPTANNLQAVVTPSNLAPDCNVMSSVNFSWNYSGASPQTHFQIEIATNNSFNSGSIVYSGTVVGSSNQNFSLSTLTSGTYYWRLKVWDSNGLDSGWLKNNTSFTVSVIKAIDFSWSPSTPLINQNVNFTSQAFINVSSYAWTFQGANISNSSSPNPTNIKFSSIGAKAITLSITTPDNQHCTVSKNLVIGGGGEI